MSEHYIEFENVTKSYGTGSAQVHALDGVSFGIEKGEFCILLGSSGAGKTTGWIPSPAEKSYLTAKTSPISASGSSLNTAAMRWALSFSSIT